MSNHGPWGNEEFDALSWHDVHVHALRLERFDESEGTADLILDVDYILEWQKSGSGILFNVCQADLRFHNVFGLKVSLDYASPSAGMCPFSIAGIERKSFTAPTGFRSYHWRIPINWPQGSLEFDAPSFSQRLVGKPHVQSRQFLAAEKRTGRGAA
jgi:hypothetical protein